MTWASLKSPTLAGVSFFLGSLFGGYQLPVTPPVPKICPAVQGHAVISSSSTKDGEYCTYAQIKGKVLRPVKI